MGKNKFSTLKANHFPKAELRDRQFAEVALLDLAGVRLLLIDGALPRGSAGDKGKPVAGKGAVSQPPIL